MSEDEEKKAKAEEEPAEDQAEEGFATETEFRTRPVEIRIEETERET